MSNKLTTTQLRSMVQGDSSKSLYAKMQALAPDIKGFDVQKLGQQLLLAASSNPQILNCSKESILKSMMHAAELGLNISGLQGDAYIVPYKGTAQFLPGYRGLLRLLRRSGNVKSIEANVVFEGEHFVNRSGTDPVFEHEPTSPSRRGELIGVYALVHYKDGGMDKAFLWKEEVDKIRDNSPSARSSSSPWHKWYNEMAKKTAIRALMKYTPLQTETYEALARAEEADYSIVEEEERPQARGASSLNQDLGLDVQDVESEDIETPPVKKKAPTKKKAPAKKAPAQEAPPHPADSDFTPPPPEEYDAPPAKAPKKRGRPKKAQPKSIEVEAEVVNTETGEVNEAPPKPKRKPQPEPKFGPPTPQSAYDSELPFG